MRWNALLLTVLAWSAAAQTPPAPTPAAAPTKIAILQFQEAILSTQEGKKTAEAMQAKFDPRRKELEKRQADLQAKQDRLAKGTATMSAQARADLQKEIDAGAKLLNRDAEDLNTDVQNEENNALAAMAGKIGTVIQKYGVDNGFAMIVDVSGQQTPVLWASPAVNITAEIIKLYDAAHPVKSAAAAPAAANPQAQPSKQ